MNIGFKEIHVNFFTSYFTKFRANSRKMDSIIQPDDFELPAQPTGPFAMKSYLKFTQRNMKNGGITVRVALTATAIVTKEPLSAEVNIPICLKRRRATSYYTIGPLVNMPVSSMFHICQRTLV